MTTDWYVLNFIYQPGLLRARAVVDRFNVTNGTDLELFAPTYVAREESRGDIRFRTLSLTFHYVFVRGTFDLVKRLCGESNGFSFLIDRANEHRYAVIPDRQMTHFKNIARAYKNCLPYFPLDDVNLEDGDLVEVVRGDFPGLVGTYMPNPRSKSGNIVLNVFNKVGTIAFNVRAIDVRVLEFSKNFTRANDQIDAFVPHLLEALRYFNRGEMLPTALAGKLAMFCGRMEVARLNNRKLDARLQMLLYGAARITGHTDLATRSLRRYLQVADAVSNRWTLALLGLIRALADGETVPAVILPDAEPESRMQRLIADEYARYAG